MTCEAYCRITVIESGGVIYAKSLMAVCPSMFRYIEDTIKVQWENVA